MFSFLWEGFGGGEEQLRFCFDVWEEVEILNSCDLTCLKIYSGLEEAKSEMNVTVLPVATL